jgi:hypothetical protein
MRRVLYFEGSKIRSLRGFFQDFFPTGGGAAADIKLYFYQYSVFEFERRVERPSILSLQLSLKLRYALNQLLLTPSTIICRFIHFRRGR